MSGYIQVTFRSLNRNVLLYLLATALLGFAIDGGVYSVLFNLYVLRLGFGPEFVGQINSAGLLVFALSSLPAGATGSRFGSRRMMVFGLAAILVGGALLPMAEWLAPGHPERWLMAGYVSIYLGLAFYFVNAVPYLMDVTQPGDRSRVFSLQAAVLALAAFTGSIVGGIMPRVFATILGISQDAALPYRLPLLVAVAVMAPALWAILRTKERDEMAPDEDQALDGLDRFPVWRAAAGMLLPLFVILSLVRFLQVAGVATTGTFFNVYMDNALGVPTLYIGLITAMGRLLAVPAALLTPMLMDRWGAPRSVVIASAVTSLSLLPLALSAFWPAAGLGFIGVTASSATRYPAFLAYSMEQVPPAWRGALSGAGEMAGGLSFSLMALVGGYLIVGFGYSALFATGAALTIAGTVLFWLYAMMPRQRRVVASIP